MSDTPGSPEFRPAEIMMLAEAYGYALSYVDAAPPLNPSERRNLVRLVVMGGIARRSLSRELASWIDAHSLAAEVVDLFLTIQDLQNVESPKPPRFLFCQQP